MINAVQGGHISTIGGQSCEFSERLWVFLRDSIRSVTFVSDTDCDQLSSIQTRKPS